MGALINLFAGPLGGIITGTFGSLVTNIFNYFKQKQAHKQSIELKKLEMESRKLDHKLAIVEAEANMKITQAEIEGKIQTEEAKAFLESQRNAMVSLFKASFLDKLMGVSGWLRYITIPIAGIVAFMFGMVDFVKHLMRPGITIFLIIVFANILKQALGILNETDHQWTVDQAVKIVMLTVDATVYLTVACVSWWFSDRQIARFMAKALGHDDGSVK